MKAFLAAAVAMAVISVGASFVLNETFDKTAAERYQKPDSVRLSD